MVLKVTKKEILAYLGIGKRASPDGPSGQNLFAPLQLFGGVVGAARPLPGGNVLKLATFVTGEAAKVQGPVL